MILRIVTELIKCVKNDVFTPKNNGKREKNHVEKLNNYSIEN